MGAVLMYGSILSEVVRGRGGVPWVARLLGFDPKYTFQREFIKGVWDYTCVKKSNRHRGKYIYWAVPPGFYEVYDAGETKRYFCQIAESGDVIEISKDEVIECLKNATSESTS